MAVREYFPPRPFSEARNAILEDPSRILMKRALHLCLHSIVTKKGNEVKMSKKRSKETENIHTWDAPNPSKKEKKNTFVLLCVIPIRRVKCVCTFGHVRVLNFFESYLIHLEFIFYLQSVSEYLFSSRTQNHAIICVILIYSTPYTLYLSYYTYNVAIRKHASIHTYKKIYIIMLNIPQDLFASRLYDSFFFFFCAFWNRFFCF